ncbi:MAG: aminotransferase class I/II-fold pyridoxal phosphate-dependent enzyme [Candidatus Aminicenantes bacterium]|nr:aminotransferase class I/II-fold pyridoxal phosphate-dependent enzyme [Candidatus Aminicenantes bacterium]
MTTFSDFRSDTVTRPTPEMRRAMAEAEVGDDVLGDDPTVNKLEELAAATMGKEAGLYVPSGTMGNSIAVKAWTHELEEVIVEARSHVYNMESTSMTLVSRVMPRPLSSRRGAMDPADVGAAVRVPSVHTPRTSLVCVENTHNNWSGAVLPLDNLKAIRALADRHGLRVHMDGARIFNASTASGVPVKEYASYCDSVMFCLSKGLSAPVGSMVVGPRDFIDYGRRIRKALGGGMRQVGVLAAAGLIALTKMPARLHEDHERARRLASALAGLRGMKIDPAEVETNIVIFGFEHPRLSVPALLERMREKGVWALPVGGGVRMVTHKDVGDADVDRAVAAFREILS